MIEWLSLVPALAAGLALGILHFGGLWLTIQLLPVARQPVLLAIGSLAGRLGITLLGLYLVTGGLCAKIGVCLVVLFGTRTILVRHWQPKKTKAVKERSHRGA